MIELKGTLMKHLRWTLTIGVTLAVLTSALAQEGDQAIYDSARAASNRGTQLLRENRRDEAIAAFREAVRISGGLSYFTSEFNDALARALTAVGRTEEALDAYRQAVRWDAAKEELDITYAPVQIAMDYAILLAQAGRDEDAKALYYYGLRIFNAGSHANGRAEPFPFLVVFDPDADMVHWRYSTDNIVAAALVLAPRPYLPRDPLRTARTMKPDWIIPAIYSVWQDFVDHQERERLAAAIRLARTQEEREWAALYQPVLELTDWQEQLHMFEQVADRLAAIGLERRKNSVVLRRAKENLRNIHHRIAVTRDR